MLLTTRSVLWAVALAGLSVTVLPARAATPKVKDHARLFSEAAVRQTAEQLLEIKRHYRADVVIETFPKIPFHRDPWHKFKKLNPAAQDTFFRNWAKGRVPGPDGIYVFIFQGPEAQSINIEVGRDVGAARKFTADDGAEVRDRLRGESHAGHNDQALLGAVRDIRSRLDRNLGGSVAPKPFDWPGMAAIIVPLAGAWLALVLIQVFRGGEFRAPFAGVSTLGHGIGCNFATCLRAALAAPDTAPAPPPTTEHGESAGVPGNLHRQEQAGYAEHVHGD